jgi:Secretion system C-terminal sorting domain
MQQTHSRKQKVFFLHLLLTIFSFGYAQDSPLALSWDKPGCQQDTINKVSFDDNFSNLPCLKVCKSTIVTYKISGDYMQNVDHVKWYPIGGQKVENKDLSAMPIIWDNTGTGSLRLIVVLLDGQTIDKTICVDKINSSLIFGWDKTGCQMNMNSTNELKLENNLATTSCLKVCKKSQITYRLDGGNTENIRTVTWDISGGSPDVQIEERQLSMPINWSDDSEGSIQLHIEFESGDVIDKTICIEKIESSIILDWEKIPESAVRQIKFDTNPDNPESIMVYPESTVLYTLDGKQIGDVETISWIITGGYVYNPNQFAAIVSWEEAEENALEIVVNYKNGTTLTRKISIVNKNTPGGGQNAVNAVKFTYDDLGNQIRRHFIYLSARHKLPDDNEEFDTRILKNDIYEDISYYPNPVRSELFVAWKNKKDESVQQLEVYDMNGRILRTYPNQLLNENAIIDFESYPSGLYELLIIYDNNEKKVLKIVKQ